MQQQATVLIIPGLRDHVPQHWQTLLAERLQATRKVVSVPPLELDKLSCTARVEAIQACMQAIAEPVVVVAHSGGVAMFVHWAQKYRHAMAGALLATPADLETPLPEGYPSLDVFRANGWLPMPRGRLEFPSLVVASSNDPLAAPQRVAEMARDWGSALIDIGAVGHLNPASGFGEWPQALAFIQRIESLQGL